MRKIRKIISGLTFLGLGLLTTSTCVIMTSCKSIIDKNRDFIMEHTISLMVSGVQSDGQPAGSQAIATAWLFQKDHDYQWYVASNWHVQYSCYTTLKNNNENRLWFSYETNAKHPSYRYTFNNTSPSSYQMIDPNAYSLDDWKFPRMKHVDEDNRKYDYGVDVSIVKINFANNVVQDKVFKNRLNKLTNVKVCQNEQDNVNANLFIGGFPYTTFADSDNIRFTFFNFNIVNVFQYQTLETGNSDEANQGGWVHPAVIPGQYGVAKSLANMFIMNNFAGNSKGGSSGSMCINEKQELVGVLWGSFSGGGADGPSECLAVDVLISKQKSFFNPNGYNVIKDYWNDQWISGLPT